MTSPTLVHRTQCRPWMTSSPAVQHEQVTGRPSRATPRKTDATTALMDLDRSRDDPYSAHEPTIAAGESKVSCIAPPASPHHCAGLANACLAPPSFSFPSRPCCRPAVPPPATTSDFGVSAWQPRGAHAAADKEAGVLRRREASPRPVPASSCTEPSPRARLPPPRAIPSARAAATVNPPGHRRRLASSSMPDHRRLADWGRDNEEDKTYGIG
jgi:hypothetical protein